jgi:acyl carrier protein
MNLKQFINDLEEAIEDLEAGTLQPETDYKALSVWDSLAVLTVIAMVDAEYEVSINAAHLKDCGTVLALFEKVKERSK